MAKQMWRAALVRRGRTLTALLAMAIAATVATALLNLYADAQRKLRAEFRGYGANVVVAAKNGGACRACADCRKSGRQCGDSNDDGRRPRIGDARTRRKWWDEC